MNYVRKGAYWGILYSVVGWFFQYGGILTGNLPDSDSMADTILLHTDPGAELFTGIIIWSVIGAIIGTIVWGFAIAGRKTEGREAQPQAASAGRISRLAIVTIVMFLLALVASSYASTQLISLRA